MAILRAHDVAEVSSLCRVEKTVVTGRRVSVVAKYGEGEPLYVSALERAKTLFSIPPIFSVF